MRTSPLRRAQQTAIMLIAVFGAIGCSEPTPDELAGPIAQQESAVDSGTDDREPELAPPTSMRASANDGLEDASPSSGADPAAAEESPTSVSENSLTASESTAGDDALALANGAIAGWPYPVEGSSSLYSNAVEVVPFGLTGAAAHDELIRLALYQTALGTSIESPQCELAGRSDRTFPAADDPSVADRGWYVLCTAQYSDEITKAFATPPQPITIGFEVAADQIRAITDLVEPTFDFAERYEQHILGPGATEFTNSCSADLLSEQCANARVALAHAAAQQ